MIVEDISDQLASLNLPEYIKKKLFPPAYPFGQIFSKYVFKDTISPNITQFPNSELFDFKVRKIEDRNDTERSAKFISDHLKLFVWKDYPSQQSSLPRYFYVWLSP